MKTFLPILILFLAINSSMATNPQSNPPSHEAFTQLLKKYVDDAGLVNYAGLKKDRTSLKAYLAILENNAPNGTWSKDAQLAYWINAYNAYTLDLILEYYPLESIKDIGSKFPIPDVKSPWDLKFIKIAGKPISLNNIEHGIIRNQFNEPRIHFVLYCAAVSCATLSKEAFEADKIDKQLTAAAKDFISNSEKNYIKNANEAELSKVFSWYEKDFNIKSSLIAYLNQYSSIKLSENAKIRYKEYDWTLNDQ